MNRVVLAAALALVMVGASGAQANVIVNVDKSNQHMTVSVDGRPVYSFVVSTGRSGYGTPNGVYHPTRLEKVWFSKEYYSSPMPHSIFFHGGYAIHGSFEISRLGGPASHGCIRLHPADAAKLFALVQDEGMSKTTIVVSGQNPHINRPAVEQAATTPAESGSSYRGSSGGQQGYQPYQSYQGYQSYQTYRGYQTYQERQSAQQPSIYGRPASRPQGYQYWQPYSADPYAPRRNRE